MALCLLPATEQFWAGNTGIWLAAGVALAASFGWPSVVCFIKPTLFVFAGVGAWRCSWWIAVAILVAVSLPFGSMWIDYVHVGLNARYTGGGLAYSAYEIPLLLIPIAAWIGGREGPLLSRRQSRIEVNTLDDDPGRPSPGAASSADKASEDVPHRVEASWRTGGRLRPGDPPEISRTLRPARRSPRGALASRGTSVECPRVPT